MTDLVAVNRMSSFVKEITLSGLCDRDQTLPSCLVFWSCSLVYVLCFMLERGVRITALLSCFRPSSAFVSGFGHSCSRFGLAVGACGLEFARAARSSVRVHSLSHFVARSSFFVCLLSLVFSCSVWHTACLFHWLRAFMFVMFCVCGL